MLFLCFLDLFLDDDPLLYVMFLRLWDRFILRVCDSEYFERRSFLEPPDFNSGNHLFSVASKMATDALPSRLRS